MGLRGDGGVRGGEGRSPCICLWVLSQLRTQDAGIYQSFRVQPHLSDKNVVVQ